MSHLDDGTDALAIVRTLRAPYGQIAFVHPMSAVLADWRDGVLRMAAALVATIVVLLSVAAAYFWQAARARKADIFCNRIRDRIDTALNRGRCGLWDWDLARGHVYWSDSMYDMLGMKPERAFLSFGEINALVHPHDGDLAHVAEMLAASQAKAVDHSFRMRHADGHWIWLRARAEIVREGPGEAAHLVGIARRYIGAKDPRRTDSYGKHAAAGCAGDRLRSLCSLGQRKSAGHVQFKVPAISQSS
ncbi:MAG: PAS domain-containing protein [Methylovirgula sp.]